MLHLLTRKATNFFYKMAQSIQLESKTILAHVRMSFSFKWNKKRSTNEQLNRTSKKILYAQTHIQKIASTLAIGI